MLPHHNQSAVTAALMALRTPSILPIQDPAGTAGCRSWIDCLKRLSLAAIVELIKAR